MIGHVHLFINHKCACGEPEFELWSRETLRLFGRNSICEVCEQQMRYHDWVKIDIYGIVAFCSMGA